MFRSISWQLQFSYGLLLLLALVGLGGVGFLNQKSRMLREIDESLQLRSRRINSMMVRHDLQGLAISEHTGKVPQLPPLPGTVEEGENEALYYKVWKVEGGELQLIFQSLKAPELVGPVPQPKDIPIDGITLMSGQHRRVFSRAVRSYVIMVGQDISKNKALLNRFLLQMIFWESVCLVGFVFAGYWLTRRALSPIGQISDTARTIAEGGLNERISLEKGSSELRDLSQVLNESFDQLEGSILRQRDFTSNASHELRTPITAILSEGQSKPKSIDDYRHSLDRCVDTARSMKQLVDQLLELSRFDSGSGELDFEATDLDILVSRAILMIRPVAEEKSIQIESHLDLVQADVNSVRIRQVVINLLSNAVYYTSEGGEIKVSLSETKEAIEIVVEDNGIGISKEDFPYIFNRFFRADKSRSDHGGQRFGLGLAISQEIAKAHGGELRVESDVGKGSIFTLHLPKKRVDHKSERLHRLS